MSIPHLPLTGDAPAYCEIGNRIRDAILNGQLTPGTRIPAVQELARQHDVSVYTIQSALVPLVKAGLIERRQKHGTYVRNRAGSLGGVGVYFGIGDLRASEMAFYSQLQQETLNQLKARGAVVKLWVDPRSSDEQHEPLPEMQRAIERREVQGLIVGLSNQVSGKWLHSLNVPTSHFGSADYPGKVFSRLSDIFKLGFQDLQRQGCKTVGIMMNVSLRFLSDQTDDDPQFFDNLAESGKRYGLILNEKWNRMPDKGVNSHNLELNGYLQFQSLWKQAKRPDGLIIFPDVMVRGAITSMLEMGVSVPVDLKLVLHRNEGLSYVNPFPSSYVNTSPRQRASELIEQMCRQIEGKKAAPVYHSMVLESS